MNPERERWLDAPPQSRKCPKCRDMGFTVAAALIPEFEHPEMLSAAVIFTHGIACSCAAGRLFAHTQGNWNMPMEAKR